MQISDDIFLGPAFAGGPGMADSSQGPSPQYVGVGPVGRIYVFDIVPSALNAAGYAAAQQLAGAGNLVLTAGTGVTASVVNGQTRYSVDYDRCVTLTSTGNLSGVTFTITGYDRYGQRLSAAIAGPNNNTVATTKAFKSVVSIAASGAVGTDVTAGFNDKFGLPVFLPNIGYILSVKWNSVLAQDAGTAVVGSVSPQTTITTDVRGCYTPANAADGSKRLVMAIALNGLAAGPNATRNGAFGLNQNLEPSSGGVL
jgi:VCBS repeat-containing protein